MRRDTYLAPRHHCKQPCHRGSRYRSMRGEHWVGVGVAGRCVGIPQSCEPPMIRIESRIRGETRWPRHMGANTKQRGPSPRNITHTPTGVAVGGLVTRTVGAESPKIRLMRCSCPAIGWTCHADPLDRAAAHARGVCGARRSVGLPWRDADAGLAPHAQPDARRLRLRSRVGCRRREEASRDPALGGLHEGCAA